MIKDIIIGIFMLVSALMVFESWTYVNVASCMGWLTALVFQSILLSQDLFEDEPEEVTKFARKRIVAFNKLMELTKEPK
jgi:hypothetical protein